MKNKPGQVAIILGMHRSGTSVLAGVLSLLGINPGDCLMPANADVNPKGFWEHAEIVGVHEQILDVLGSSWDDIAQLPKMWWKTAEVLPFKSKLVKILYRDFKNEPLWLVKDPRLCRLLPLWLEILSELEVQPYFIICLRNPIEVAGSLLKRDGIINDEAYLLWLRYILEAERWSREYSRLIVRYEDILDNWRSVTNEIEQGMNISLKNQEQKEIRLIQEFIEPSLRHHIASTDNVEKSGKIEKLALEAYQYLKSITDENATDLLLALDIQLDDLCDLYYPWASKARLLRKQVKSLGDRCERQASEIARIKSTISWRITKPLRFCAFLSRRAFRRS